MDSVLSLVSHARSGAASAAAGELRNQLLYRAAGPTIFEGLRACLADLKAGKPDLQVLADAELVTDALAVRVMQLGVILVSGRHGPPAEHRAEKIAEIVREAASIPIQLRPVLMGERRDAPSDEVVIVLDDSADDASPAPPPKVAQGPGQPSPPPPKRQRLETNGQDNTSSSSAAGRQGSLGLPSTSGRSWAAAAAAAAATVSARRRGGVPGPGSSRGRSALPMCRRRCLRTVSWVRRLARCRRTCAGSGWR